MVRFGGLYREDSIEDGVGAWNQVDKAIVGNERD